MADSFVHLHVHTDNSMLDGAARIDELIAEAVRLEMPAIAITDHGTMFGAFEFWKKATNAGIKPIIGLEAYVAPEGRFHKKPVRWGDGGEDDTSGTGAYTHMTLLAETTEGMHNLFKLSSAGYLEGYYQKPRLDREILAELGSGLIATTGCASGEVQTRIRRGEYDLALQAAAEMRDILGRDNYFVEIMDHGIDIEKRAMMDLLRLAKDLDIPLIASNDLHYTHAHDAASHDAVLCVQTGSKLEDTQRFKFGSHEFYLKSSEQMRSLFRDLPEACDNTLLIAERCEVTFDTNANYMPRFPAPEGETEDSLFVREVWEGLARRYPDGVTPEVKARAEYEIGVITEKGFPGYYLVVADFIGWARKNGIRVGPGRGSGAGSIAAYAMGITDLDPLEHGLLFERFLNPERESLPDFDIDFGPRRRDEVKHYVTEKYGSDHVAQIVTYNIIKAKQALKDASRVLGFPYELGDRLTKAMPPSVLGKDMSLGDLFDKDHSRFKEAATFREVVESDPMAKIAYETARGMEKIKRNTGVHAAGVIMSSKPLADIVPLMMRDSDGQIITQFDYPSCEELGLVKMDFLGLRNLDILDDALENISMNRGVDIVLEDLPFNDPGVYELLSTGETLGIFQLDSPPMRDLLRKMKPDNFEDISAVLALYRPGPMGADSHNNYALRKNNLQEIVPIHPELKESLAPVLEPTYGLIVYQEQVMEIARIVAGYSLAQADLLRRAMGKKKKEILDKEFAPFSAGMIERGYSMAATKALWEILVPFSDYAFNKSHSAAYGVVSYFTAYLKAHYPAEYLAALLTSVRDDREKMGMYMVEARRMGVTLLPPDINESQVNFAAVGENMRFGLGMIRNVGVSVTEHILAARAEHGAYTGFYDFLSKVPVQALNKRTVEALIKAGAFDSFGDSRRALLEIHESAVDEAAKDKRGASRGDVGFDFEELYDAPINTIPDRPEWPKKIKLEFEREMLGQFVSDHPLNGLDKMLVRESDFPIVTLRVDEKITAGEDADSESESTFELQGANEGDTIRLAGLLRSVEHRVARNSGNPYGMAVLEDQSGTILLSFMGKSYLENRDQLVQDAIVAVRGRVRLREAEVSVGVFDVRTLDSSREEIVSVVKFALHERHTTEARLRDLAEVLERHPGDVDVEFRVLTASGARVFALPHKVAPSGSLYAEIKRILGPNCFD